MLRNKIISIVALATIGLASPTGAFARGGGGGHGGRRLLQCEDACESR